MLRNRLLEAVQCLINWFCVVTVVFMSSQNPHILEQTSSTDYTSFLFIDELTGGKTIQKVNKTSFICSFIHSLLKAPWKDFCDTRLKISAWIIWKALLWLRVIFHCDLSCHLHPNYFSSHQIGNSLLKSPLWEMTACWWWGCDPWISFVCQSEKFTFSACLLSLLYES